MARFHRAIGVVALAATAAACSSGQPGAITSAGTQALEPQVRTVREVAANGNYHQLKNEVQRLIQLVEQQQNNGNVSARRAAAIENAADVLLNDASPSPSPTPTPVITTFSPTPTQTTQSPTPTPTTASPTPTPTPTSPSPITTTPTSPKPGNGPKAVAQPVATSTTTATTTATAASSAQPV